MRPRSCSYFLDYSELVRGPDMGRVVVNGHQRRQLPVFDERHTDRGGNADRLEGSGLMRGDFPEIIIDDERQPSAQTSDGQGSEIREPIMAEDVDGTWSRPVSADREAILVTVHISITAARDAEVFSSHAS